MTSVLTSNSLWRQYSPRGENRCREQLHQTAQNFWIQQGESKGNNCVWPPGIPKESGTKEEGRGTIPQESINNIAWEIQEETNWQNQLVQGEEEGCQGRETEEKRKAGENSGRRGGIQGREKGE